MSLPQIAIVGRPNVGKSSLMNRLARRRVSIVDPTPGVTRDRVSVVLEFDPPVSAPRGTEPRLAEISDTGGYGVYTAEGRRFNEIGADLAALTPEIEAQIALAIERATVVCFVVDAQAGLTALDHAIARLLRKRCDPGRVLPVANKVDGERWVADGLEAAGLGFGEPSCVSATSGLGVREMLDTLHGRLASEPPAARGEAEEMKLAIVGKRNAGKSTLINALAGEQRVIVSEIAGTTRDSVDVRFDIEGRRLLAIDTAGVRKRKSFADAIEQYAYGRMLDAITRADVAVLLVDATAEVSQVDKKLSLELQERFKPTVIVVNKWDRVDPKKTSPEDYLDYLTEQLRGLDYAPIVFVSATEGDGLRDAVAMAFNLFEQAGHRVGTGELNRVVEGILRRRGPSSRLGSQARLYFAAQLGVRPPTVVLVVNQPSLFRGRYERYLLNRLREELPYSEIPIRVLFRKRRRMDLQELKEGAKKRRMESDEATRRRSDEEVSQP